MIVIFSLLLSQGERLPVATLSFVQKQWERCVSLLLGTMSGGGSREEEIWE